jgi:hypothetical protein
LVNTRSELLGDMTRCEKRHGATSETRLAKPAAQVWSRHPGDVYNKMTLVAAQQDYPNLRFAPALRQRREARQELSWSGQVYEEVNTMLTETGTLADQKTYLRWRGCARPRQRAAYKAYMDEVFKLSKCWADQSSRRAWKLLTTGATDSAWKSLSANGRGRGVFAQASCRPRPWSKTTSAAYAERIQTQWMSAATKAGSPEKKSMPSPSKSATRQVEGLFRP